MCAAIGVATGLATALSTPLHGVAATLVPLYGLVLGFNALPGVVAQQVLRLPWVALITHLLTAAIASAFVPVMAGRYFLAAVVFGGAQEIMSALTRYRHWELWRFLLTGAITGALLTVPLWFAFDVASFAPWAGIVFIALFIAGPVAWTAVGVGIGSGLRRAGVTHQNA